MNTTDFKLKEGHWKPGINTKADLDEKIIRQGGCELSSATMREEDLIPTFCDYLDGFEGFERLIEEAKVYLANYIKVKDILNGMRVENFWDSPEYQAAQELVTWVLNEDIWNALNNVAPAGYYFGSSFGDGSLYGFFKCEEELF